MSHTRRTTPAGRPGGAGRPLSDHFVLFANRKALVRSLWLLLCLQCCYANALAETNRQGQKIGIVSLLGQRFDMVYLGHLAFSDESKAVNVKSWGVDEHLLSGLLYGKNGSCFKKPPRRAMRALHRVYDTSESGWLYSKNYDLKQIKELLKKIGKALGVEKWLLILKNKSTDRILDTDRHFVGFGLYRNAYHKKSVYLYAYTGVLLFDTRSGRVVKSLRIASSRKLKAEYWPKQGSWLNRKQSLALRNTFNRMLANDLKNAVKTLCRATF